MSMDNLFSLKGRVALITGGSRGIGAMIAEGYLRAGAKVYISARKAGPCLEAAKELSQYGECIAIPGDVSSVEGCRELAAQLLKQESKLDILVNNAGAAWGAPFAEFPENGWDKVMDVNVKGPFFLTQALFGALKAGGSKEQPSKVINIGSVDGISVNMLETYSYAASKAGIIHLTKRMALELVRDNIVMSAIAPGAFASEMNKVARDHADLVSQAVPSGRVGTIEDMAGTAIFLASRAGDYIVGTTVVCDGGIASTRGGPIAG